MSEVVDLRRARAPWAQRRESGKGRRDTVPRSEHGEWRARADRQDPVRQLQQATTRAPDLVALRAARMIASPFAYYRGAADMMVHDLVSTPRTGVLAQICGDAHCLNFGFYGSPAGVVVFDVNDFDETAVGPWEWDVKRLAVSLVLAGRANGTDGSSCRAAVSTAVRTYREVAAGFEHLGVQDLWAVALDDGSPLVHQVGRDDAEFERAFARARRHTDASAVPKLTEVVDGRRRFVFRAPVLEEVDGQRADELTDALERYAGTTSVDTMTLLGGYHVVDVARKVVGVGSVGSDDLVVLLEGEGQHDPLLLQIKQAVPSDVRLALGDPSPVHEGERIVRGQRLMQAVSDRFLGWATSGDVPYYVRMLKDLKGSMRLETLAGGTLEDYAALCAAILARSHSRTADPAVIAGYCGTASTFDDAITRFAVAYADQVERDHAEVAAALGHCGSGTGAGT